MENYRRQELIQKGISCGRNVQIHKTVQFFGNNIHIGSNVRIDCFCVITSREPVRFGNYIHIGVGSHIFGAAGVTIADYATLSSRCSVFTTSDDYTDGYMTNPTVPDDYKRVRVAPVELMKHVIVGCGSVIMPGVKLNQGASIGALSFVNRDVPEFAICAGTPIRVLGQRDRQQLLALEKRFKEELLHGQDD